MNPLILGMLRSLGINPAELMAAVQHLATMAQLIEQELGLIVQQQKLTLAQQELTLAKLTRLEEFAAIVASGPRGRPVPAQLAHIRNGSEDLPSHVIEGADDGTDT